MSAEPIKPLVAEAEVPPPIIIKKIIGKIIVLVLAAILIFIGWQQRQHVIDFANSVKDDACDQSVTFLGVDVALPDDWCQPI